MHMIIKTYNMKREDKKYGIDFLNMFLHNNKNIPYLTK